MGKPPRSAPYDGSMERNRGGRPRHPDVLTPAEWRVLEALREGGTNAEIAARLGVSTNTVRYHVSNMLAKLELRDRRALAAGAAMPLRASRDHPRQGPRREAGLRKGRERVFYRLPNGLEGVYDVATERMGGSFGAGGAMPASRATRSISLIPSSA